MLCTAGVGLPPGGEWSSSGGEEICQERVDVSHYLEDMEILADVMETQGHWHPSLEGIGTPWVRAQESRQHSVSLDTKPNKMTAAILNLYGSFLSSSTQ